MSKNGNYESALKRKVKEELPSDEEEETIAPPVPAKRSKDCPYLDSINRKVLDFGKCCKITSLIGVHISVLIYNYV